MIDMIDLNVFLGGAAAGAIFTGFVKVLADYLTDRRTNRNAHEAELRSAYEAWAMCLEEAKEIALYYGSLVQDTNEPGAVDRFRKEVLKISRRVGAGRARLMLLEDDAKLRARVTELASKYFGVVGLVRTFDPEELKKLPKSVEKLEDELYKELERVAKDRAVARNRFW